MIMNPESILYTACILVNASWLLGDFDFLHLLGIFLYGYGGGNPMVKTLLGQSAKRVGQKRRQILRYHAPKDWSRLPHEE